MTVSNRLNRSLLWTPYLKNPLLVCTAFGWNTCLSSRILCSGCFVFLMQGGAPMCFAAGGINFLQKWIYVWCIFQVAANVLVSGRSHASNPLSRQLQTSYATSHQTRLYFTVIVW